MRPRQRKSISFCRQRATNVTVNSFSRCATFSSEIWGRIVAQAWSRTGAAMPRNTSCSPATK